MSPVVGLVGLWSQTDPSVLIDSRSRLESTRLVSPSSSFCGEMHTNRNTHLHTHTKVRQMDPTWTHIWTHLSGDRFFVHWYELTPINHRLQRLSVNVIQTAGAGTAGWLNVCESVWIGVCSLLYSCRRSCRRYELWPWPSLAQAMGGHLDTRRHSHTDTQTLHPHVSCRVSCWLCQILSWHTNTIALSSCTWLQIPFIPLIHWPHIIQLAKMALSCFALWPHLPCLKNKPPITCWCRLWHGWETSRYISLMFFFCGSPLVFVSLVLIVCGDLTKIDAN